MTISIKHQKKAWCVRESNSSVFTKPEGKFRFVSFYMADSFRHNTIPVYGTGAQVFVDQYSEKTLIYTVFPPEGLDVLDEVSITSEDAADRLVRRL